MAVLAECERCGGTWQVIGGLDPEILEGACMDCQEESDVEKPLTFRRVPDGAMTAFLPYLPSSWLAFNPATSEAIFHALSRRILGDDD
jgi:hypothetical protein